LETVAIIKVLVLVFIVLDVVVLVFCHDAMYSPLNRDGHSKRQFHDAMLAQARAFVDAFPFTPPSASRNISSFPSSPGPPQVAIVILYPVLNAHIRI
jgi:hypothetical protein